MGNLYFGLKLLNFWNVKNNSFFLTNHRNSCITMFGDLKTFSCFPSFWRGFSFIFIFLLRKRSKIGKTKEKYNSCVLNLASFAFNIPFSMNIQKIILLFLVKINWNTQMMFSCLIFLGPFHLLFNIFYSFNYSHFSLLSLKLLFSIFFFFFFLKIKKKKKKKKKIFWE